MNEKQNDCRAGTNPANTSSGFTTVPPGAASTPPAAPILPVDPPPHKAATPYRWMPLAWRLVGGAAILIAFLGGMALYHQMQAQLGGLRNDLGALTRDVHKDLEQINLSHGAMVKKGDHDNRLRTVWDSMKELRADRSDLTMLKERCSALLEVFKAGEAERRQLTEELRRLRERQTGADERGELVREIRELRLRLAHIEGSRRNPSVTPANHVEPSPSPAKP